jgi:RsmE family RNA methyltransferase
MEQGMNTYMPQVSIHERFRPFIEDETDKLFEPDTLRLVAHPSDVVNIAKLCCSSNLGPKARIVVAIGPEGGWIDYELDAFKAKSFIPVCCSSRVMSVDTAVCAILAQLEVLETV